MAASMTTLLSKVSKVTFRTLHQAKVQTMSLGVMFSATLENLLIVGKRSTTVREVLQSRVIPIRYKKKALAILVVSSVVS